MPRKKSRGIEEFLPFSSRTKLILTTDNHNSVNGLREFARRGHTRTIYVPTQEPELRVNPALLKSVLSRRTFLETLFMAVMGIPSAEVWLRCATRRSSVSANWDYRLICCATRVYDRELVQAVWLPNWSRLLGRTPFCVRSPVPPMVLGRHNQGCHCCDAMARYGHG
jgi:hypothetical protein